MARAPPAPSPRVMLPVMVPVDCSTRSPTRTAASSSGAGPKIPSVRFLRASARTTVARTKPARSTTPSRSSSSRMRASQLPGCRPGSENTPSLFARATRAVPSMEANAKGAGPPPPSRTARPLISPAPRASCRSSLKKHDGVARAAAETRDARALRIRCFNRKARSAGSQAPGATPRSQRHRSARSGSAPCSSLSEQLFSCDVGVVEVGGAVRGAACSARRAPTCTDVQSPLNADLTNAVDADEARPPFELETACACASPASPPRS